MRKLAALVGVSGTEVSAVLPGRPRLRTSLNDRVEGFCRTMRVGVGGALGAGSSDTFVFNLGGASLDEAIFGVMDFLKMLKRCDLRAREKASRLGEQQKDSGRIVYGCHETSA